MPEHVIQGCWQDRNGTEHVLLKTESVLFYSERLLHGTDSFLSCTLEVIRGDATLIL